MGFFTGINMVTYPNIAGLPSCQLPGELPSVTIGVLIKETDSFFSTAANLPLPIMSAFTYNLMKAGGASKAQLDRYRASALFAASQ
jgi:hypothetical protein